MKYFGAHGHLKGYAHGLFIVKATNSDEAYQKLRNAIYLVENRWENWESTLREELQEIKGEWAKILQPTIDHIEACEIQYYVSLGFGVYYFEV